MTTLQRLIERAYDLETQTIDVYGSFHAEAKALRRQAFAMANDISALERHIDVLMQQLIRRIQDLELAFDESGEEEPADDQ